MHTDKRYCFENGKDLLFTDIVAQAWLQAILDFPNFKDTLTTGLAAAPLIDELVPQTCCIDDPGAFGRFIGAAWMHPYLQVSQHTTERNIVYEIGVLKPLPRDEALELLKKTFTIEPRQDFHRRLFQHALQTVYAWTAMQDAQETR